jgi:peptidoglycan/xylan/chitin deacetylase (PgdA/CDA1 family)
MSRSQKLVGTMTRMLHGAFGSRAGNRVGILLYHRIHPFIPGLPEPTFNVRPELFRAQLSGLIGAGFRFISLDEVLRARCTGTPLSPQSVVVTFDDAYEAVYHYAWPILRDLGIPAVAFLSTAYLDSPRPFPFDRWSQLHQYRIPPEAYRPLRVELCQEMMAEGSFEFGAHTHTHEDFRGRPDDLQRDLRRCVGVLRDAFGYDDVTFAFPYGKTNLGYAGGAMNAAARAAGVVCALTTDCSLIDPLCDDPFSWGRFSCSSWDTSAALAAKLAGWYRWIPQVRHWIDRTRGYDRSCEFDAPMLVEDLNEKTSSPAMT